MAKFTYKGTTEDGKETRGKIESESIRSAMTSLMDRGLDVSDLREKKSVLQFEITKKKLKLADVMHFSRQLTAFLRAGVPILDALEVIEEETDEKTLRLVMREIRENIKTGDTFSAALERHSTLFPPFYVDMLKAAELTGTLDDVLDQMSDYIERDLDARQKIKSALIYPAIILVMAIITVIVLSVWVLPRFKIFFSQFNATLPLPTRMLLSMTNFFSNWWWAIIAGIVSVFVILMISGRTRSGRRLWDKFTLKIAIIGELIRFTIIERFCRLLASMMSAGVPLPDAMAVLGRGTNNVMFEEGLEKVREAMMRGEGLARPMAQTKLFPGAVLQMVRVGEDTGTLGIQLETAAKYYGKELEYKVKQFTSLFEPAVITVMGFVVGFVAIAMISAMYGIYHQIKI
jgi:type IV pilus assembly protein PilC